jgi:hypothetical protein
MWGPDSHSLNPKIIPYRIEIFITNLFSCHLTAFLIYMIRFIGNCWRTWDLKIYQLTKFNFLRIIKDALRNAKEEARGYFAFLPFFLTRAFLTTRATVDWYITTVPHRW